MLAELWGSKASVISNLRFFGAGFAHLGGILGRFSHFECAYFLHALLILKGMVGSFLDLVVFPRDVLRAACY